jgi:hypothetical protein
MYTAKSGYRVALETEKPELRDRGGNYGMILSYLLKSSSFYGGHALRVFLRG